MAKTHKGLSLSKYYVHIIANGEPKEAHETLDSAIEEAKRLAQTAGTANKEIRIYGEVMRYKVEKVLTYLTDNEPRND